jgi:peroxiredoxin
MELVLVVSSILLWILVLLHLLLTLALARRMNAKLSQFRDSFADIPKLELCQPAPDFSAQMLDGSQVSLASYAGRNVAFVFISPTCSPCREKMPVLNALQPQAKKAGVELVLVSDSDRNEAKKFSNDFNTNIPMLIAPRTDNPFMTDYKAVGTPFYCLVADDGNMQATGFLDDEWEKLTKAWETSPIKVFKKGGEIARIG